jgi:hypothetical protein
LCRGSVSIRSVRLGGSSDRLGDGDACTSPATNSSSLLSAIFSCTNGPAWKKRVGVAWNMTEVADPSKYCLWYGVTCDGQRRVSSLSLDDLGLEGQLPQAISGVPLTSFSVASNTLLTGPIPSFDQGVPLARLVVSASGLTGAVPALPATVVELRLDSTLVTLPAGWASGAWSGVQVLVLDYLNINTPLPDTFAAGFRSLTYFSAVECGITGTLPASLGLPSLTVLDLSRNSMMTGPIPDSYAKLGGATHNATLNLAKDSALTGTLPLALCKNKDIACNTQGAPLACPAGYTGFCCFAFCF